MNVRFSDRAIRCRGTSAELQQLLTGRAIELELCLPRDRRFLVNVRPSGEHLVEQLHHAGGVPAVLKELAPLLDGDALTVTGKPLADGFAAAEALDRDVVATLDAPLGPPGAISVVRGSLAPSGALVKRSAASPSNRGRLSCTSGTLAPTFILPVASRT